MIIIGDSDFLTDQFAQNSPENIAFGIGSIAWLGEEESLADIQLKQRGAARLLFENETQIALVKYGNLAFAIVLPIGYGMFRLLRRRNLRRFTYASRTI